MLKLVQRLCVVVGAGLVAAFGGCRPAADVAAPLPQASKALLSHATAQGAVQFALTDRNTTSGVPINSDRFLVEAYTIKPASIAAVTAYVTGPAELSVEGGSPVQASEQGWVTIPLLPPPVMPVERVVIAVKPLSGVPVSINEIELWSAGGTTAWRPLTMMVSSANAQDPGLALMRPEPDHGNLFPADTSDAYGSAPTCMDVVFDVAADPAAFARVAFTYEATGLAGSFSLLRAVNGLGAVGGYALSATSNMTRYVEHIPTAHLARGINRLHLCGPQAGTQTIRLQSMMLIAEAERNLAWFGTADMLTDGEGSTAASVTARDFAFTRPSKVVGVMVHHAGDADVQVMLDGQPAVIRDRVRGANGTMLWLDSPPAASVATINAGGATLSEVHWLGSPVGTASTPRLVFNHPQHGEYFGNQAVITGFVDGAAIGTLGQVLLASEHINPVEVATVNGVFGALVFRLPAEQPKDTWWVDVTVVMTDGARLAERVVFLGDALPGSTGTTGRATSGQDPEVERAHYGLEGDSVNGTVTPGHGGDIRLGDRVGVSVPGGAVATDTVITVKRPSRHALPALNPGMVNVTAPRDAFYQFLPPGTRFAQPVTITVPYDPSLIPQGKGPQDVKTFYFDGSQRQFVALERAHVDTNSETVVSLTDHFTDMINAVLVEPESPAPALFNPNQVASMAVADPTANMTLIAPPTPNKDGTANLSYPFTLPKARGRYQPQLALSYTSEGGWGLAGEGWNVSVSSVDVETRFGAPRYEMHNGSPVPGKPPVGERYLLDGQQLVPADNDPSAACRDGSETQRFVFRKEGAFMRILRCGTDDANFHWEVTDKNGNWMLYGSSIQSREADPAPKIGGPLTCQDSGRNIGRWLLEKVRDANGNETVFNYEVREGCGLPLLETPWTSRLLKSIEYTIGTNDQGAPLQASYRVELSYGPRTDVNISGRMGFKSVKNQILTDVKVWWCNGGCGGNDGGNNNTLIRQYKLEHQAPTEASLFKTLLKSVTACAGHENLGCDYVPPPLDGGSPAPDVEKHTTTFGYEDVNMAMDVAEAWMLPPGNLAPLQASMNAGVNVQGSVGINVAAVGRQRGGVGISGNFNGNVGAGQTVSLLIDVNGDGLPDHFTVPTPVDLAQQVASGLGSKLGIDIPNSDRNVSFNVGRRGQKFLKVTQRGDHPGDPSLAGMGAMLPPLLGADISGGTGAGGGFNMGIEFVGLTGNASVSGSVSGSLVFPTDINGDGLTDFAGPLPLYQNRNADGELEFANPPGTQSVQDCIPFATEVPDGGTAENGEELSLSPTGIPELLKRISEGSTKKDVVWRWRAPKSGNIRVHVEATPVVECSALTQLDPNFKHPKLEVLILPRTLLPQPGDLRLRDLVPPGFEGILTEMSSNAPSWVNGAMTTITGTISQLADAAGLNSHADTLPDGYGPDPIDGRLFPDKLVDVAPGAEVLVRVAGGDSCISELSGGALDTVITNIDITYTDPVVPSPLTTDDNHFSSIADFRTFGATPYVFDQDATITLKSGRVDKRAGKTLADYVDVSLVHISCMPPDPQTLVGRLIPNGEFLPASGPPTLGSGFNPAAFAGDVDHLLGAVKDQLQAVVTDLGCTRRRRAVDRTVGTDGGAVSPYTTLVDDNIDIAHEENPDLAHSIVASSQVSFSVQKGDSVILLVKGRTPIDPESIAVTPFEMDVHPVEGTAFTARVPADITWRRLTTPAGLYSHRRLARGTHKVSFNASIWPDLWSQVRGIAGETEDEAVPHLVVQMPGRVLKRVALKATSPVDQFCDSLLSPWSQSGCPPGGPEASYCATSPDKVLECQLIPCMPDIGDVVDACPRPYRDLCAHGYGHCSITFLDTCTSNDDCSEVPSVSAQSCVSRTEHYYYCKNATCPLGVCPECNLDLGIGCPTGTCTVGQRTVERCDQSGLACPPGGICPDFEFKKSQSCLPFLPCAPDGCLSDPGCGSVRSCTAAALSICPTLSAPCLPGTTPGSGCDRLFRHLAGTLGCDIQQCTAASIPSLVVYPLIIPDVEFDVPEDAEVFVTIEPPTQALISLPPERWDVPGWLEYLQRWLLDVEVGAVYPVERWMVSQAFSAVALRPLTRISVDGNTLDTFNILAPEASFGLPLPLQVLSWWGLAMTEGYRGWGYGEWQRRLELPPLPEDRLSIPLLGPVGPGDNPLALPALERLKKLRIQNVPSFGATQGVDDPISEAVEFASAGPELIGDIFPPASDVTGFLRDPDTRMRVVTKLLTPPDFMPRVKMLQASGDRYAGTCPGAYVAAGVSQPSRCSSGAPIEIPGFKLPAPPLGDVREQVQRLITCPTGAPRVTASLGASLGGTLTVIGASASGNISTSMSDYRDMTGDGIPDIVLLTPLGLMVIRAEPGAPHGLPSVPVLFFGELQQLSFSATLSPQKGNIIGHEGIPFTPSPGMSLSFNGQAATLVDMNGDGLADLVSAAPIPGCLGVSVRLNLGTRFANPPDCWSGYTAFLPISDDAPRAIRNIAQAAPKALNTGVSLSGDIQVPFGLSFIHPRLNSVHAGVNVSAAVQFDELSDINGDGLPDRVFYVGGQEMHVQLNNGHRFQPPVPWSIGERNTALQALNNAPFPELIGTTADGAIRIALPNGESKVLEPPEPGVAPENRAARLAPIGKLARNALKRVYKLQSNDDSFKGKVINAFTNLQDALLPRTLNTSITLGASAGAGIEVAPRVQIGAAGGSIPVSGSAGGNVSVTFTDAMFMDINGDGLPEPIQRVVFRQVDGTLRAAILVHPNRAGTGNRLKSVTNPLGGGFELTYGEEGNTFEMPSHKYVLTGIVKRSNAYNGISAAGLTAAERPTSADRASDTAERISYRDGRYDRHNKEFLGFGTVVVEEMDGESGPALRTTCQEYHNTQFETAGQLRKTVRAKAVASGAPEQACVLNKLDEELHEYHDLKVVQTPRVGCITPAPLPANACTSTVSHELSIHKISYEGSTSALDSSEEFSTYDAYGNITLYKDYGDVADATDDVWLTTTFEPPSAQHYLPSLQARFTAGELKAGGKILRAREGEYTPEGLMTVYRVFDGAGHQLETIRAWSDNGNIQSITAPTGYTKKYVFDATTATYPMLVEGRMGSVDGPLDQSASRTWDLAHGVMLTETDANGGTLTFTYDEFGRLKTVTAPGESAADITMEYAGKRATTTHKVPPGATEGPVTIQAVDGLGQPLWTAKTAVVDGTPTYAVANRALKDGLGRPRVAGLVQAVSFAALASLVTADASAALFAPTRTDVDDKDRPTYVYEPQAAPSEGSRVSRKEYSAANGRLRTDAYDAKNNHTATVQDSAGNTVEVWEYNGAEIGTVTYVFDALKQVTRIEDAERPNPNVTTITYDGLGRQSSVTTPDTGTTTFEYDSVGRLKKKIDPRGKEVVNNYEPGSSRVVSITRTGETRDYTFTYGLEGDPNKATGRILRSQDEDGEETYVYNALGATTKITRTLLTNDVFETTFDYDSFNRVRSITYPDGESVQYEYDAAGQVKSAASTDALYVQSIHYDEFGQRKQVTYGNGVVETFAIDPNTRRVTGIKSGIFQDITLGYDDVNNITSISDPGTLTRTLDYDALNRLTSDTMRVTMGDGSYKQHISTFTFDKLHRMRKQVQTVTTDINPTGTTESHDWTYEYTRTPHAVSGITGDATPFVYRHDVAGNMEYSKQGSDERTITWTADGFERRHQRGTSVTEYFYDSNAQRRAKNTDGSVTHYLGPHATKSAVGLSKHVFVGLQRVATAIGNNRVFYHTDHIGTTSVLTDKDGALQQKVWLYPYGGVFKEVNGTSAAVVVDQRFLLTGKEWDAESGDYYFGWRYLDPDIAAWLSADPDIQWLKQGPVGLNVYQYSNWNPIRNFDPDGRDVYVFLWAPQQSSRGNFFTGAGAREGQWGHSAIGVTRAAAGSASAPRSVDLFGKSSSNPLATGRDKRATAKNEPKREISEADVATYESDNQRPPDVILRLKTTPEQDQSVRSRAARLEKEDYEQQNNCADMCAGSLTPLGMNVEKERPRMRETREFKYFLGKKTFTTPGGLLKALTDAKDPALKNVQIEVVKDVNRDVFMTPMPYEASK